MLREAEKMTNLQLLGVFNCKLFVFFASPNKIGHDLERKQ